MTEAAEKKREPNWGSGMALGVVFGVTMSILLDNWAFLAVGIALSAAFAYGTGTNASDDATIDDAVGEDPTGGAGVPGRANDGDTTNGPDGFDDGDDADPTDADMGDSPDGDTDPDGEEPADDIGDTDDTDDTDTGGAPDRPGPATT